VSDAEAVLITGFPGIQARKLLADVLAEEPHTQVHVVVMPRWLARAAEALETLSAEFQARVRILEGDAAALDMGLSGREYRSLANSVTRIHHVAHVSYVGVAREVAEHTNVRGAVEAVELARTCEHLSCLIHHSTAYVSGDRTGTVYEDQLDEKQGFHNLVQETRMKAELVMQRAMAELPIAVLRPTLLVGDSGTGEADRFDGPYLLVMLILGLPKDMAVPLPRPANNPVDIVPVDYVVKAARWIGRHSDAPGHTFHLTSSEQLTAEQVFDLVAQAGGRRTVQSFIPAQVARAVLATPGIERLLREPRELLQHLATGARYDTRHATRVLADSGLSCPPLASYVDTWVTAVQEHLRDRRPPPSASNPVEDVLDG